MTEVRWRCRNQLGQLYENGLRPTLLGASELWPLKVGDVDQKTGQVYAKHSLDGSAKFGKGHIVVLGREARRALWYYATE